MADYLQAHLEFLVEFLVRFRGGAPFEALVERANAELTNRIGSDQALRQTRLQVKYILSFADDFNLHHLKPYSHLAKHPIKAEQLELIPALLARTSSSAPSISPVGDQDGVHSETGFCSSEAANSYSGEAINYKNLAESDKKPYVRPLESLGLSKRSINRLANMGIQFTGDIVADNKVWTDEEIKDVPGVGNKTYVEIRGLIDQYQAKLTPILGWVRPERGHDASEWLIETPEGASLEQEVSFALGMEEAGYKRELLAARLGIGSFESRHTLQELGDRNFWPDAEPRTRERARQVVKKTVGKIHAARINFSTLKTVEAIVKKRPFWTQKALGCELELAGVAVPRQLFRSVMALQNFACSEPYAIREGVDPLLFDSELSKSKFEEDMSSLRRLYKDKLFLLVSDLKKVSSFSNIKLTDYPELSIPSVICKSEDGREFVARKVARLKSHVSYSDTMIAKIFSLTSKVRLEFLIEAVLSSSGRKPDSIPNNDRTLLKNYLLQHPCLSIEDGLVKSLQRPVVSYLRDVDLAVLACATKYGVEISTEELHRWLLKELNCSEQSARQKAMFSPLLVTLSKGRGAKPGVKRLVCDLEDVDLVKEAFSSPIKNLEITIRNSIRLKRTGEAGIEEEVPDGLYPIVLKDDPSNDIGVLKVKNGRVSNLRDIANAYESDRFTFHFDSEQGVFSLQK